MERSPEEIEKRRQLVQEMPFLQIRNWQTDKVKPDDTFEFIELDEIPAGWWDIGVRMFREIKQYLLEHGGQKALDEFRIDQLKEKFGSIRCYFHPDDDGVQDIINKYEWESGETCCECGKPATRMSKGWICPYCDDCGRLSDGSNNPDCFVPIKKEQGGLDKATEEALYQYEPLRRKEETT